MTSEKADTEAIIQTICAFGLPGAVRGSQPPSLGEEDWTQVVGSLRGSRITGFAVAAAEAGWWHLTAEQTDGLLEAHRAEMLTPLAVERSLLEISTEFDRSQVQFVVLKGPALAHTFYPDPSWRFFGDLDLLVRAEDWRRAVAILEGLGYRRKLPEPRAGFDEQFGKAAELRREKGIEVDLHRTLVIGPFGMWIEPNLLFEGTTNFQLWGRTLRRLNDSQLMLHACMHASLGWWPPLKVPVRDVAQVAHYGQVDWDAVAQRAARWKLRAVVSQALQMASTTLEVELPAGAYQVVATKAGRRERRALRGYVGSRRDQGGTALGTVRAIRGTRAKLAYIRALILPSREFLAFRAGASRGSYLRRWAIPIRWVLRQRRPRRRSTSQ